MGISRTKTCFLMSVFITFFFSYVYRPFINENQINDLGVAGIAPSFTGYFAMLFFMAMRDTQLPNYTKILYTGFGAILYETLQPTLKTGLFDWYDVLAIAVAVIISLILSDRLFPGKKLQNK